MVPYLSLLPPFKLIAQEERVRGSFFVCVSLCRMQITHAHTYPRHHRLAGEEATALQGRTWKKKKQVARQGSLQAGPELLLGSALEAFH